MKKTENVKTPTPTKEMVIEWVKRDAVTAHYFLGVLIRYPEVLEKCADMIYQHAMEKENGAGIDHLPKE